jgi:hypothetical protein
MALPVWVRLASLDDDLPQVVRSGVVPLLQMFRGKLFKVARLGFDPYEEKFGFAGDQDIGSTVKCATEEEALAVASQWQGLVLSYKLLDVISYLHVYLWMAQSRTCMAVEVDSSILFYRQDEYSDGDWLGRFLMALAPAVGATVCAYGMGYEVEYQPLDPASIVQLVRSGEVLSRPYPSFHAVSDALVSEREVQDALRAYHRPSRTTYVATTTGYHVFLNLK